MDIVKRKFLIIRFSSIGDIVLTTPVIRCLKTQIPNAEIHYVVKKKFGMVLEANPYIDKLHYLDGNIKELIQTFRKEEFEYVIDLHKTLRSYRLRLALGRPVLTFNKLSVEKLLITKFHIDLLPKNIHIVERNLEALKPLGVTNDGKPVDYFIKSEDQFELSQLPLQFQEKGYIAFVIGGQHFTKRLPVEKIVELCNQLCAPVVLLGGPEDAAIGNFVAKQVGNKVFNLCGKLRFNQSVSVLEQSKIVIAHDTGLMHISGAFNKPVVSIWGATSPDKFGVAPYLNTQQFIAKVDGLLCNPCSNFGTSKCPRGHFKCMKQQDIAAIVASSDKMFATISS